MRGTAPMMHARTARGWLAVSLLVILPALTLRGAFAGYFLLDDFGMLSIVRLVGNPLHVFVENHIPGGFYYRPLGMLWWWLSERLFGSIAAWHYLLNALAQGAVTLALWRWLTRASGFPRLAFGAAVVFAVHPVAIGTTLWLSDRFDLLAALFGLLGLHAAWRFAGTGHGRDWAGTLVWIGLALLSKEIALVMLAAVFAAWLFADAGIAMRRRALALASLVVLAALYLFVRWLVIVDAGASYLLAQMPFVDLLRTGLAHGVRAAIDYLGHWPRLTGWKAILAFAGVALLVPALVLRARASWSRARWRLLMAGAVLAFAPLLLQVPLLALQDLTLPASGNDILLAFHARHFYVCCIGLLAIGVALLSAPATPRDAVGRLAAAATALLVVVGFSASQHMAKLYRDATLGQRAFVESAHAALATIALPRHGCRIFLLDTGSWPFAWVSDEAIKATATDLDRLAGCLIQTEHTPW
ncbi:MAG: glycosyltransferase family 39 protein [Xanthomonadales bacterium]|nr:glycosyltransferase family 39 protein [Xanthomonadales bacterium]